MLRLAGSYAPLKSPLKHLLKSRRLHQIQHWRSLPSLREPAAIAPMVARQASSTATNPGMDAPRPVTFSRPRAETCATSKPTKSARNTDCLLAGTALPSGGIAAAWPPAINSRSPSSSEQDVSGKHIAGSLSQLALGLTSAWLAADFHRPSCCSLYARRAD